MYFQLLNDPSLKSLNMQIKRVQEQLKSVDDRIEELEGHSVQMISFSTIRINDEDVYLILFLNRKTLPRGMSSKMSNALKMWK